MAGDELDVSGVVGPEAVLLRYEQVGSRIEACEPVEAGRRADRLGDGAGLQGLEHDGHIGNRRSGRIKNATDQCGRPDLGRCLASAEEAG